MSLRHRAAAAPSTRTYLFLSLLVLLIARPAISSDNKSVDEFRYGVVFDAGSSGTRATIFRWQTPSKDGQDIGSVLSPEQNVHAVVQSLEQIGHKKITPGISYQESKAGIEYISIASNISPGI